MKHVFAVATVLVAALTAQAHFIWLAPIDGNRVRMVFSDDTEPDENVPIKKIAQTRVHIRTGDKTVAADKMAGDDHYLIALPGAGSAEVGAVCEYGVLAKGGNPFLLCYYAKTLVKDAAAQGLNHPLEIFPVTAGTFEVRWQAKPASGLEVVVNAPGQETSTVKTDGAGRFTVAPAKTGVLRMRAKHVEAKTGERDGKEFREIRHYATLTMGSAGPSASGASKK